MIYYIRVAMWLFLLFATAGWAYSASAAPVAVGGDGDIKVTLTDEKCRLPAVVNLPYRVTWDEKGKTVEGCYGPTQFRGLLMFYFADKTAMPMPMSAFQPVTGL